MKLENYYIYQSYGKIRRAKDRLLEKLGDSFTGLITIVMKKPASYIDYTSINYHYILDNTEWKRINIDTQLALIVANKLDYEHVELH